jgi:transposase InsO family protein
MNMIGKINHPSSKGHQYILAIMDYFTKWVEAIPMKSVTSKDVINFIKEHVIHRFGIPKTIMTDGGSVIIFEEFRKFAADVGIKLIRSSPYYVQANAQSFVRSIVGTPHFMSWSNKNFAISSGV